MKPPASRSLIGSKVSYFGRCLLTPLSNFISAALLEHSAIPH